MLLGMGAVSLGIWACGRPCGQPCGGGRGCVDRCNPSQLLSSGITGPRVECQVCFFLGMLLRSDCTFLGLSFLIRKMGYLIYLIRLLRVLDETYRRVLCPPRYRHNTYITR